MLASRGFSGRPSSRFSGIHAAPCLFPRSGQRQGTSSSDLFWGSLEWFSLGQFAKRKRSLSFLWWSGWGWSLILGVFLASLWLLSGRALRFMAFSVWIRLDGRAAFFGMAGYLLCLELMVMFLGLLMLSMLLVQAFGGCYWFLFWGWS